MFFPSTSILRITFTVADWPSGDVVVEDQLDLLGTGDPFTAYHRLKGAAANMTWPQGSQAYPFPGTSYFANQLLTDTYGHDYGIRSWSVTALPGRVPGRLTVASYKSTNLNNAAPDDIADFDLGPGAWDSGALPVQATTGTVLWREPRLRWVPINLLSLL